MRGEGRQHVVEESHTGRDLGAAGAIEIEADPDLRLGGLPFQGCGTGLAHGVSLSISVSEYGGQCILEGLHLRRGAR